MLIVDDEALNIEVLKMMLNDQGIEVDIAMGGQPALNLIKERVNLTLAGTHAMYKLILLDYSMPEIDGPQVAKETRSLLQEQGI